MNAQYGSLSPARHAQIFEKVASESGLAEVTSQARPHAIILAGQPGAGKGGLVNTAVREFKGDIITVDPDQLRDFHPDVKNFRETHPYTWSGLTHPDASQWATELRDAAVAGHKNLIIDTTLGNGDSAVKLIHELQGKGYAVEVRAIATHRLESELGVDRRFSQALDADGHGRYVPQEVRGHVYDALPGSLDKVRAGTDAPISIFNRDGQRVYDSRADARPPGEVLSQAREARVADLKTARSLNEGWKEQQTWHRALPESLPHNPKVAPSTAQNLLQERGRLQVVESVTRGTNEAGVVYQAAQQRSAGLAAKGLGAAAVAYDAATTAQRTADLLHAGNPVGGQSEILHFGGRNLGMLAGAELGAGAGAALGVESGPGLLVTGAVGGVVGAIGGNKIADAIDNQRIYNQSDKDGHSWHFDPQQPAHGWTRSAPTGELDLDAMRFSEGMPVERMKTLTADPALSNQLNYQASSTAVQLALAHPGTPHDPYTQPAGPGDTLSLSDAPWTRDAQTHAWSRQVADQMLEYGVPIARTETANPARAAQLNQAAERTVADNLAQSPRGIAERYQAAYQEQGWQPHGPTPVAVSQALHAPTNVLQASDGHTYTRAANGQWNTPGMLYGTNAAEGNRRDELDATQRAASHTPASAVINTTGATREPLPRLDDAAHPGHDMYQQALAGVHRIDASIGRTPDQQSTQLAAAVAAKAMAEGMTRIDTVAMSQDGATTFAAQHTSPLRTTAQVPTLQAVNTPLEQSTAQFTQAAQQQKTQPQPQQVQAQEPQHGRGH